MIIYRDRYHKYYVRHKKQRREASKLYYRNNRDICMAKHKTWSERNYDKIKLYGQNVHLERTLLIASIKSNPCYDCKRAYPYYVMDFDHVAGKKRNNIAILRNHKTETLFNEIAKCQLVCSNCHRIRTYDRGYKRLCSNR